MVVPSLLEGGIRVVKTDEGGGNFLSLAPRVFLARLQLGQLDVALAFGFLIRNGDGLESRWRNLLGLPLGASGVRSLGLAGGLGLREVVSADLSVRLPLSNHRSLLLGLRGRPGALGVHLQGRVRSRFLLLRGL